LGESRMPGKKMPHFKIVDASGSAARSIRKKGGGEGPGRKSAGREKTEKRRERETNRAHISPPEKFGGSRRSERLTSRNIVGWRNCSTPKSNTTRSEGGGKESQGRTKNSEPNQEGISGGANRLRAAASGRSMTAGGSFRATVLVRDARLVLIPLFGKAFQLKIRRFIGRVLPEAS